ncbi:hypothetical protein L2E82_15814 [Cichorium intybus]|uniref:Uncharacterized protein n=1 Tax=Cichorium intybus TaxID=13427 RepID=A0ACB9F4A4_CICIN|nr:hypothetical protein L2E82_15814 [Cichorium intybus]
MVPPQAYSSGLTRICVILSEISPSSIVSASRATVDGYPRSSGLFDFNYSLKTQDLANTSQNSLSRRYNLIRILKVLAITN